VTTKRRRETAQLGPAEPEGRTPRDPISAAREEAERVAQRLEELVAVRRAQAPLPKRDAASVSSARATNGPVSEGLVVGARHSGRLLGNLLVDRGFATSEQIHFALAKQHDSGLPLGQILVEFGMLDERALVELLAEQLRMDTINFRRTPIDSATCSLLPQQDARRLCALPVSRTGQHIDVAISDPTNNDVVREIIQTLRSPVRLLLATRPEIEATIDSFYGTAAAQSPTPRL
jgi:hypothetical protein